MEEKSSRLGIASFSISIVVGCFMVMLIVVATFLDRGRIHYGDDNLSYKIVGLMMIVLMAADVVAMGLGIANICQSGRKRLFGILGLVFSSVTLVGTITLVIVGLIYEARFAK